MATAASIVPSRTGCVRSNKKKPWNQLLTTGYSAMPLGNFVQPETIPKPLKIGRAGRLIFGVGALYYFAWLIIQREFLIDPSGIDLRLWVGVFFVFYYLPDLFVVGLSLRWGRWPQAAALVILMVLVAADFAAYGSGWAPPLAWAIYTFTTFYYGLIGVAFLSAAILAVPG